MKPIRRPLVRNLTPIAVALALASFGCSSDSETEAPKPVAQASEAASVSPDALPDVVAKVNGVAIEKKALMERVATIRNQAPPGEDTDSIEFFSRVLEDLVSAELLYQASRDNDLLVTDEAMEERLGVLRARFPDEAAFEQALGSEGLTLEKLKTEMERDMSIQRYIETAVETDASVSEEETRRFYDENAEEMRQPDRLRVRHILKRASPDAPEDQKQAARTALRELSEQVAAGADFAELAREHSEDPGTATNGGELTIAPGQTVPPFEQAAFALEEGEVSDVVETQFGFHLIELAERIEGEPVPYEQARSRIEGFLKQQAAREAVQAAVSALRESANVEVFIGA